MAKKASPYSKEGEFQIATNRKRRKNNSNPTPEEMQSEYEDAPAIESAIISNGDSDVIIKDRVASLGMENQEIAIFKKEGATLLCKLDKALDKTKSLEELL